MNKETDNSVCNCKDMLNKLVNAGYENMDKLREHYTQKLTNTDQLKDIIKWSGSVITTEAYLASIAHSLATIADCMTENE